MSRPAVTRVTFDLSEWKEPLNKQTTIFSKKKKKKKRNERTTPPLPPPFKVKNEELKKRKKERNKKTKPWTLKVALRPSGVSLVTKGNEKADELAKDGVMMDGGVMAQIRASTVQQKKRRRSMRRCKTQPVFIIWLRNGKTVKNSNPPKHKQAQRKRQGCILLSREGMGTAGCINKRAGGKIVCGRFQERH